MEDDENETYDIVSSGEADALKNKIFDESPLGSSLIGHKVGDTVVAQTPGGGLELKIVSIGKQNL